MPKLSSLASISRPHYARSVSSAVLQAGWSQLTTGLNSSHTILKPNFHSFNGGNYFGLIDGTQNILKYDPNAGTFSSSSANVHPTTATTVVQSYSKVTSVVVSSVVYAFTVLRSTYSASPLQYLDVYQRSTDGYLYGSNIGGGNSYLSTFFPQSNGMVTAANRLLVSSKGGFGGTSSGGNFNGSTCTLFSAGECSSITCHFSTDSVILAGGSGATAKIARISGAQLATGSTAWSTITNTIGEAISSLHAADVYLNYTYNSGTGSYMSTGSRSYILLAGCVNGKIARSTDGGLTWSTPSSQPFTTGDTVVDFANWEIGIYCLTSTGKLAYSLDGGSTWELITTGISTSTTLNSVTRLDSNRIVLTGSSAFLASWTIPPYIQA